MSLWSPWTSSVPFDKVEAARHVRYSGSNLDMVGDGEEKFADEIGGLRTLSDDHDVMGIDYIRYEVKKLTLSGDKKTRNIRASIAGSEAHELIRRAKSICDEIRSFLDAVKWKHDGEWLNTHERVSGQFYQGTVRMKALLGYFPSTSGYEKTRGLKQNVSDIAYAIKGVDESRRFEAIIGERLIEDIDVRKYVRMMRAAGLSPSEATDEEIAFACVEDPAFRDPMELDRLWNAVKPSNVILWRADRLVLVDEQMGYCVVPNDRLDELVVFTGIGYGKDVSFRVVKEIVSM